MTAISKSVADVLGKPIFAYLDDDARKIRRNLLFISFVCLSISFLGISISADSTLLGIKFSNLKDSHIRTGLAIFSGYFLIHFMWVAFESYGEWSIRVTGTKVAFTTGAKLGSVDGDYPDDPRNSSLNNWWVHLAKEFPKEYKEFSSVSAEILNKIKEVQAMRTEFVVEPGHFTLSADKKRVQDFESKIHNKLSEVWGQLNVLNKNHEVILKFIESERISESLRRFDGRFRSLLVSQNLRWLLFDVSFPIFLGLASIFLLVFHHPNSLSDCFCKV